jgi:hypothetical protein
MLCAAPETDYGGSTPVAFAPFRLAEFSGAGSSSPRPPRCSADTARAFACSGPGKSDGGSPAAAARHCLIGVMLVSYAIGLNLIGMATL